jgi:hypothetical protein
MTPAKRESSKFETRSKRNQSVDGAQFHGVQDADSRRFAVRELNGHSFGFLWRAGDGADRHRPLRRHLLHGHSTENEIGVRMALEANRNDILRMVLRDAAILLGTGPVVGTGITIAAGTVAASMLFGLKPRDPLTMAAAIAGIVGVGLAASLLPAQRAANTHPMAALREE